MILTCPDHHDAAYPCRRHTNDRIAGASTVYGTSQADRATANNNGWRNTAARCAAAERRTAAANNKLIGCVYLPCSCVRDGKRSWKVNCRKIGLYELDRLVASKGKPRVPIDATNGRCYAALIAVNGEPRTTAQIRKNIAVQYPGKQRVCRSVVC